MKTFSQFLYEASATQQRLNDLRDQNRQQNAARYAAKRKAASEIMQQIKYINNLK